MARVDFPKLDFDRVVGIPVIAGRQDVEAATARGGQFLSKDRHLAQTKPRRLRSEPVLKPDLVVSEFAEPGWSAGVQRRALLIHRQKVRASPRRARSGEIACGSLDPVQLPQLPAGRLPLEVRERKRMFRILEVGKRLR
jgi:hypothetical protein